VANIVVVDVLVRKRLSKLILLKLLLLEKKKNRPSLSTGTILLFNPRKGARPWISAFQFSFSDNESSS